jgi:hypothetical protein
MLIVNLNKPFVSNYLVTITSRQLVTCGFIGRLLIYVTRGDGGVVLDGKTGVILAFQLWKTGKTNEKKYH